MNPDTNCEEHRINLYIDIDGVLLGRDRGDGVSTVLAEGVYELIGYVLSHFNCYWLTTHCPGDADCALRYIEPFCSRKVMNLAKRIKPTKFDTLKTESLRGDFYWIEDAPLASELAVLRKRGMLDRWLEANTRERPKDLLRVLATLKKIAEGYG